MICKETLFSDHAITQMFKRNISVDDVKFALVNGELIVTYVNDKPFPSYLLLAYVGNRPIHILTGKDETLERCIIITAYEPDESIWEIGFKLKKK
ncbi:MAG: DUF4258 domain-containing protein [Mucilaginibacter sp.]|nr:DUF4258 domain-containing protein [Mucilaginibacter sp.]